MARMSLLEQPSSSLADIQRRHPLVAPGEPLARVDLIFILSSWKSRITLLHCLVSSSCAMQCPCPSSTMWSFQFQCTKLSTRCMVCTTCGGVSTGASGRRVNVQLRQEESLPSTLRCSGAERHKSFDAHQTTLPRTRASIVKRSRA